MHPTQLLDVENRLTEIYRREAELYRGLLNEMDALPVDQLADSVAEEKLHQMAQVMNQVAQLDETAAPLRERWKTLGGKPERAIGRVFRDVEELIVALMQRIKDAEAAALEAKSRLAPQLSAESRRRRMSHAYQAARQQS